MGNTTDDGVFRARIFPDVFRRLKAPALNNVLRHLRQLRKTRQLSQERFAELAGISYKYYQAVEAGRKRELRLSTLERLARAHGLEVHELLAPKLPARFRIR